METHNIESQEEYCEVNTIVNTYGGEKKEKVEVHPYLEYVEPEPEPPREDADKRIARVHWASPVAVEVKIPCEPDIAGDVSGQPDKQPVVAGRRRVFRTVQSEILKIFLGATRKTVEFPKLLFENWYKTKANTEDTTEMPTVTTQLDLDLIFHEYYIKLYRRSQIPKYYRNYLEGWENRNPFWAENIEMQRRHRANETAKRDTENAKRIKAQRQAVRYLQNQKKCRENARAIWKEKVEAERQRAKMRFGGMTIQEICEEQMQREATRRRIEELEGVLNVQDRDARENRATKRHLRVLERMSMRMRTEERQEEEAGIRRDNINAQLLSSTYSCPRCHLTHDPFWNCKH